MSGARCRTAGRAIRAEDRIADGIGHLGDQRQAGAIIGRVGAAQIPVGTAGIGADHDKAVLGREAAMADAGGDHDGIAGRDLDGGTARATELHARAAGGDAEHFVRGGVIVVEGIDAVDPGVAPSVRREQILDVLRVAGREGVAIEDERQARVVGNGAVVVQEVLFDLRHWFVVGHGLVLWAGDFKA